MDFSKLHDTRVLIMGLGAHGGGEASARFFASHGARVTVTDLRTRAELASSVQSLRPYPITFVLGEHRLQDFREADVVIKNPAVPRTSEYLRAARVVETDISVFLSCCRGSVFGITGTKGKSTTSSVLAHILNVANEDARLGGNITISPLSFLDSVTDTTATVLELSSFQLGDLKLTRTYQEGRCALFAGTAVTNLLPDHQDYYPSMEAYAADKAVIFERQQPGSPVVLSNDDQYSILYKPPYPNDTFRIVGDGPDSLCLEATGGRTIRTAAEIVPTVESLRGDHSRRNAFIAAVLAVETGLPPRAVTDALASFPGVPHRLELAGEIAGVRYVNDSAATIQESTLAAVRSYNEPIHLIAGGSDKGLPLDLFPAIAGQSRSIHLLAGSATERMLELFQTSGISYSGPHSSMESALAAAGAAAAPGDVVLLSPGCASFGLFKNEFDRGDQFRALVHDRIKA